MDAFPSHHLKWRESKAPSGNSKRKTPARFGSCKRSNFLPLTQTLKPPNPPTSPRLGSETRDRDIIRLKSRYCIRPRVLSYPRAVRTCHGSGKLSCLSRVVLHTFASLSHLSHLKVFGTFLLYSIRTSDLHSRPDQQFSMAPFKPPKPNPALFTNEHHEIFMGESPELDPKPHECIVHVRCNGICG